MQSFEERLIGFLLGAVCGPSDRACNSLGQCLSQLSAMTLEKLWKSLDSAPVLVDILCLYDSCCNEKEHAFACDLLYISKSIVAVPHKGNV